MYRREFIKKGIAGSAGLAIGSGFLFHTSCKGANDKIVLAVIGAGTWGMTGVIKCCKINENVTIKTLCDVSRTRLALSAAWVEKELGYSPATTENMKEVLDDKDVDAVWVSTPTHWHALATVWACQARKDVYVEKCPSLTIWEGRKMVEAARKYKRIVQVGHQNRSAAYGYTARDYIASGKLGKIVTVKCYNMLGGRKWTKQPDAPVPSWLDWDKWQGPAAVQAFNPGIVFERGNGDWGRYWAYSGGALTDGATHQLDLTRMALGDPPHPKSVYGWGGNHAWGGESETPEFQSIVYDFGDFTMTCESGEATNYMIKTPDEIRMDNTRFPQWANNGTRTEIYGTEGFMYLGRMGGGWQVMGPKNEIVAQDGGFFPFDDHLTDFIQSLRTRKKPNGDMEECHRSATLAHLGNISYRVGNQQLLFDGATEKFLNNDKANALVRGAHREGYVIPEKV